MNADRAFKDVDENNAIIRPEQKPREIYEAFIEVFKPNSVLDLFCGTGPLAIPVSQARINTYIGVDNDPKVVKFNQVRLQNLESTEDVRKASKLNYAADKGKELASDELELDNDELENMSIDESHEGSVRSGQPKLMSDAMKAVESTSPKRAQPDGENNEKKNGKKPKGKPKGRGISNEVMKLQVQSFI